MDTSNRRTPQAGEPSMDWRSRLWPNARQRVVNRTIELLRNHLPDAGQAALQEVKKIAISFEETVYTSATSKLDYLSKINLYLHTLETNSQNTMAKYLQLNSGSNSDRPRDPASFGMQPQVPNQGQSLFMPLLANQSQSHQQVLAQNIENEVPPAGVQNSAGFSSAVPTSSGLTQASIPKIIGQISNMQNMSGTSQTLDMISNSQSQMQQIVPQQQWQEQGYIPKLVQSPLEQQQQQPTQSQSSQKSVKHILNPIKPSVVKSYLSSLQQNQQSSIHHSTQPMLQQHPQSVLRGPQQANKSTLSLQSGVNTTQAIDSLHSSSGVLQYQHIRQDQEEQMHQNLLSIQFKQQQMQKQQMLEWQQYQQRSQQQAKLLQSQHQVMQQQLQKQLEPQEKQKLLVQLQVHEEQTPKVHQIHDANLEMRAGMDVTPRVVLHQHTFTDSPQQLKAGSPVPTSSTTQLPQVASPQISQRSSRQADQQNLVTRPKAGIPGHSASSPIVIPSPSTPMTPSPTPGDSEKPSSLSNAENVGHQQATGVGALVKSVAIGTPRVSASPSLSETSKPDSPHVNALSTVSSNSSVTEEPLECLIKAVKLMTQDAWISAINDISSVVNMIDIIPGSAPGNGSRASVGEDLAAMTNCSLQESNVMTRDGRNGTKRMRCSYSDVPLNVVSSADSTDDSFKQLTSSETSDLVSDATSRIKRPRTEANHALLKEIREINQLLINTVVSNDEDVDPSAAATAEGDEGTIFKCSFGAVTLSPNLKSQYDSGNMSKIQPLKLFVPTNYPESSPILLDKVPVEVSKEYEDLSVKAKSRLGTSLRSISQPMSLGEIAKTWDACAYAVISEHAKQRGGGSFTSKYGTWENCLSSV
ncbi:mediator of RNA polymerase II transcription subunit 15a [Pyrus x bretschneideri]|uniref:mediator of RNA polymerase II transcription subunit 15a n=1 Tax=Pyrus x bretschneideri TaxID=225117 RepID=UPI00202FAFD8|nr:mediator of RNA polymerase II transcription subunit 15a [Pyrus x bretschneideri]XP_048424996.1 mediator of RNA polymerase II transcription subunit 15a [Pyrus x bretschneideri]